MGNAFKALVGEEVFILAPLSESEPLEELIFGEAYCVYGHASYGKKPRTLQ